MTVGPAPRVAALDAVRAPVDSALEAFLARSRQELEELDPVAALLVDEIVRLVRSGGKRIRPACCVWGFRAAIDAREPVPTIDASSPIVRAAAAVELLHAMALIHDDVIDETPLRRGQASAAPHLAEVAAERAYPADPARFGRSAAIVVGDLAAVLADRLLLDSGFDAPALARGLARYHDMRLHMAAGQALDVAGFATQPDRAATVARLKGGSYTIEGPLLLGAALAGASEGVVATLAAFGAPLGEAFQRRDDLLDGEGAPASSAEAVEAVDALVGRARQVLASGSLQPDVATALDELARSVGE